VRNLKTLAIVFPAPGKVEIAEVELPPLGEGDVLVEIEYSAISVGTERWCLTGRLTVPDQPPLAFPHVPGYQAAGVVVETGRGVKGLKPGDRVFSRNCRKPETLPGSIELRRSVRFQRPENFLRPLEAGHPVRSPGREGSKKPEWFPGSWWGGHVGHHVADEKDVIALPGAVSTREASCLLLAQVGYNGASKPPVRPGDTAVVIGEGLVGQFAAQALRARGAYVIMAGLVQSRLALARRYSADEVFDSAKGDFAAYVRGRRPKGVEIALETASSSETVRLAVDLLAYEGHLVLNGFYPPPHSTLDWHWLRTKEITAYCPNSRTRGRLERTLALVERGKMRVEELLTHEFLFDDAPAAYGLLLDPAAEYLGIVFRWK
jgi:threonine dehydrogenase-like Zn-dependent dehydrogenase